MWTYAEHQIAGGQWALATMRKYGLAYLAWEERTRKSGTALWVVEHASVKTCLIVTKKKAMVGWEEHLAKHSTTKSYEVINYESLHKISGSYDLIILDEAHNSISAYPKVSAAWKKLFPICKGKPILYLSATPYAENIGLIYHQFKLSKWSPISYKSFYDFHRAYGIPDMAYTPTPRETYKKYETELVLDKIKHLFSFKKRSDVGIEYEPEINLIEIELAETTKVLIKTWIKDKLLTIGDTTIPNDSPGIARSVHYQLESSTIKDIGFLPSKEKLNYIKANYDLNTTVFMAHFILERELMDKELGITTLSSDGMSEGVDLSMYAKLVVCSMSDKTSKHSQRIARQANHNRKTPIIVDILVAKKPGIGKMIYEAVALKKENFVKHSYELALRNIL